MCQDNETWETLRGAEVEADIVGIIGSSVYRLYRTVRNKVTW